MPTEDTSRRRQRSRSRSGLVDPSELEVEVQMAADKSETMDTDTESNDNDQAGRTGRVAHEPIHFPGDDGAANAASEAAPFIPYCRKNLTQQKNWPLYLQRTALREYFSEFFGTLLLILFGNGVVATKSFQAEFYSITRDASGAITGYTYENTDKWQSNASYLCVAFGWGMGLAMALYVTAKVSGGHVNPAVTLTNAFFGNLPWVKVPFYILCQILGAMTGAACVYGLFRPHFDQRRDILAYERSLGMANVPTDTDALGGIFCTYPARDYYANKYCVWSELCNTAVMQMIICGCCDEEAIPMKKNALLARHRTALKISLYKQKKSRGRREAPRDEDGDAGLTEADFDLIEDALVTTRSTGGSHFMTSKPIALGLMIFVIGICSGWNSGYALNPARDLGPRMVSAMIFRSSDPFTKAGHYFWIPLTMPIVGALIGQLLYTFFILPEDVDAIAAAEARSLEMEDALEDDLGADEDGDAGPSTIRQEKKLYLASRSSERSRDAGRGSQES